MELSPIVKEVVVVSESSSCDTVCVAITYNYYSHYCMNLCFTLELILINADFFSNDCICMKKFLDAGIQDVSTSISIVHDLTEKHKFQKGLKEMMKVKNIYKYEIVGTRA